MPSLDDLLRTSLENQTFLRLVLSGRRAQDNNAPRKISVRPVTVRGQSQYQLAKQQGPQETHENVDAAMLIERVTQLFGSAFEQAQLFTTDADYLARRKPDGNVSIKRGAPTQRTAPTTHNRPHHYLLPEGVPNLFLIEIGVMSPDGKVRAAHYHKFRQINRYLEIVNDIVPHLQPDGPLMVVDFGCGKSYLTFALHYLLTEIHHREVRIAGLDLKADVVRHCNAIASRLQCRGLSFHHGDIAGHALEGKIDLAVSLHACDTATDEALAAAVRHEADVILAVPCCQHEIAAKLNSPPLALLTEHGILRERFAALATDALRAAILEVLGYRTQVIEFIDLEHTAKNLLIRAVRRRDATGHSPDRAEYEQFKRLLGIEAFHLERVLGQKFLHK